MKLLIAVITARHDSRKPFQQLARNSWIKHCPVDWVFVDASASIDGYTQMVLKNKGVFQFAMREKYDFILRICDDTFVFPERILAAGLEQFDYAGNRLAGLFDTTGGTWGAGYMHGGCGIWLSQKAFSRLAVAPWYKHVGQGTITDPVRRVEASEGIEGYVDDIWIGEILQGQLDWQNEKRWNGIGGYIEQGIKVQDDPRFVREGSLDVASAVSVHAHTLERFQQLAQYYKGEV